jgi:hypothetical protein
MKMDLASQPLSLFLFEDAAMSCLPIDIKEEQSFLIELRNVVADYRGKMPVVARLACKEYVNNFYNNHRECYNIPVLTRLLLFYWLGGMYAAFQSAEHAVNASVSEKFMLSLRHVTMRFIDNVNPRCFDRIDLVCVMVDYFSRSIVMLGVDQVGELKNFLWRMILANESHPLPRCQSTLIDIGIMLIKVCDDLAVSTNRLLPVKANTSCIDFWGDDYIGFTDYQNMISSYFSACDASAI